MMLAVTVLLTLLGAHWLDLPAEKSCHLGDAAYRVAPCASNDSEGRIADWPEQPWPPSGRSQPS